MWESSTTRYSNSWTYNNRPKISNRNSNSRSRTDKYGTRTTLAVIHSPISTTYNRIIIFHFPTVRRNRTCPGWVRISVHKFLARPGSDPTVKLRNSRNVKSDQDFGIVQIKNIKLMNWEKKRIIIIIILNLKKANARKYITNLVKRRKFSVLVDF